MPGIHSPIARHLFTLDGAVLQSGGAKNLAKGQFTIVKKDKVSANGAVVASSFAGVPDKEPLEMRLGKAPIPATRAVRNSKPYSSEIFSVKDVTNVIATFPKITEQTFDQIVIGYDGIDATTAISLDENMTTVLDITLSGEPIMYHTGQKCHVIKIHFGKEEGETDQDVINGVVKRIKEWTLPGDIPVTNFIDVRPVDSTAEAAAGTSYTQSTLTVTDGGDSNDFARVQSQYPDYKLKVDTRNGLQTVYSILHPTADALADYSFVENAMYIKGCADCAAGYTEVAGGFVYSISVEDDGTDLSTTVDNIPGFVAGTVIRQGNKGGRGLYTVVTDDEVTEAELQTYVNSTAVLLTATVELLGEVADVCSDTDTTTIAWVDGEECFASVESYTIQLKDNECGESRLEELQAAYPDLVIEEGDSAGAASQTLTLAGTSGAGTITVGGEDYTVTYATSPTATAAAFVTANAADILADHNVTVTSTGAVITFAGQGSGFPFISYAQTTANLTGTVSAIDYTTTAAVGGCQRVYSTQVITNVVCEECDPIYTDQFVTEAPGDFDFTSWELVEAPADPNALMGIMITGKPFVMYPSDIARDQIPFYETSVTIEAAGGYIEEVNESFQPQYNEPFSVRRLSRKQDRDNLGYHLLQWEDVSRAYFDGEKRHRDNQFARAVLGEESVLKLNAQYMNVQVTVLDNKYSQGFGGRSDMSTTYVIHAELGRHQDLVEYINDLAARAGVEGIKPLAV